MTVILWRTTRSLEHLRIIIQHLKMREVLRRTSAKHCPKRLINQWKFFPTGKLIINLSSGDEGFPVFSIFYVYYEQYLTIVTDACLSLGVSLIAIFLVTFLLTGLDAHSALIVFGVVLSLLVNMTGLLYWADISLNAISLINLVVVSQIYTYCKL